MQHLTQPSSLVFIAPSLSVFLSLCLSISPTLVFPRQTIFVFVHLKILCCFHATFKTISGKHLTSYQKMNKCMSSLRIYTSFENWFGKLIGECIVCKPSQSLNHCNLLSLIDPDTIVLDDSLNNSLYPYSLKVKVSFCLCLCYKQLQKARLPSTRTLHYRTVYRTINSVSKIAALLKEL